MAAIMIAHIENRPRYWLGIIDIGATVMLNMTHQAQSTMAKKPNQKVFLRILCCKKWLLNRVRPKQVLTARQLSENDQPQQLRRPKEQ